MSEGFTICCAVRPIEHYVETEGNHGRTHNTFSHYSCGNCGKVVKNLIYPADVIRHVLAKMSIQERQTIRR